MTFVAAGYAATQLHSHLADATIPGVAVRPLRQAAPSYNVVLAWTADDASPAGGPSPAASASGAFTSRERAVGDRSLIEDATCGSLDGVGGGRSGTAQPRGFGVHAAALGLFLFAAGAPSALYGVYGARWHFSAATTTAVFAVYAVALLATLLVLGDLSDAVGRRPVVLLASALLVVALVLFTAAGSVAWLYAARVVQGAATGLLTAAVSAALIDTEPVHHPGSAALVSAAAAMGGQGAGVLVAGVLVQYAPSPTRLVYVLLVAGTAALAVAVLRGVDETVPSRSRPRLRVHLGVAADVRGAFLAATPCLVATWALSSLYLSLGPDLAATITGSSNHLTSTSATALLLAAGTASAIACRRRPARWRMLTGCAVLTVGSALSVVALAVRDAPTFYASTAVAGLGFGIAFSGALQALVALARPRERAALVSAVYVVAYLAYSVPTVVAGTLSTRVGLLPTATVHSAAVAALCLTALVATARTAAPTSRRRSTS